MILLELVEEKSSLGWSGPSSPYYCYVLCIIYWSHNLGYIYTNYASKKLKEPASVLLA
jgi:hypothetical protein